MREMPDKIQVNVVGYDDNDKRVVMGVVEIINEFFIEEGMAGKYIECRPKSIKLIKKNIVKLREPKAMEEENDY